VNIKPNSKIDDFLSQPSYVKNLTEPAITVGTMTGTVAGLLTLIAFLFPHLMSPHTTQVLFVVATFALPIITAIFTRGRVWSPASVKEIIDEALKDVITTNEEGKAK
jgi:hypothetical protein